jgi:hypothetical protein
MVLAVLVLALFALQAQNPSPMQLLVIGYAGNSAADHVDQLHSLPEYLRWFK